MVVASALYRMDAYEQAYGLTRLRVFVFACELWLGWSSCWSSRPGCGCKAGWLPRAVFGAGVAMLLGLAVLNPDRFIADRNVDRYQAADASTSVPAELSADAAPALDRLPAPTASCALRTIAGRPGARAGRLVRVQRRPVSGPRIL